MARPSLYKEDTNAKALAYIAACEDEVKVLGEGKSTFISMKVNLPSVQGLALELDVNVDTLWEWAKVHEEFSDTLAKLKQLQAKVLINKGLAGVYNPTIAKLVLATNHGFHEKSETDITTKGKEISVSDEKLELMAAELEKKLRKEKV